MVVLRVCQGMVMVQAIVVVAAVEAVAAAAAVTVMEAAAAVEAAESRALSVRTMTERSIFHNQMVIKMRQRDSLWKR